MSEDYDVTYPDSRKLCAELQKFADDCGKWRATRIQSLVARARARIIDLTAHLAKTREQAEQGERLREAVTGQGFYGSSEWRTLMEWANKEGRGILANRCAAIADALEPEKTETSTETEPPEEDLVYGMILDDMEERGVIPPLEVPSEQEADAEQPCPHEKAEWRKGAIASEDGFHRIVEGWFGDDGDYLGGAGEECRVCRKPLPPKPARFLGEDDCWERLAPKGQISVKTSGWHPYEACIVWPPNRSGGRPLPTCRYGETRLEALRALVAAVEEGER